MRGSGRGRRSRGHGVAGHGRRRGQAGPAAPGARLEGPEAGASYRRTVALVQALGRPRLWTGPSRRAPRPAPVSSSWSNGRFSPARGQGLQSAADRWARIAREAAKQSKQPAVPPVEIEPSFAAALERLRVLGSSPSCSTLWPSRRCTTSWSPCAPRAGALQPARAADAPAGVALWVGPESGWTDSEREELLQGGRGAGAGLGRGVLRTETAGPVAVAVARLALGDW